MTNRRALPSLLAAILLGACSSAASTATPPTAALLPAAVASLSPSPTDCTVEGTPKDDKLVGTDGSDVICGKGGNDVLRGAGGNDTLEGGRGDDVLSAGAGDDILDGGPDKDTADYSTSEVGLRAALRNGTVTGEGADTLVATERFIGSPRADTITGTAGDDDIDAGGGNDRVKALGGDDTARGSDGSDVIIGGQGADTCLQGPGSGRSDCERTWIPVPFARTEGLTLMEPARDPILIAYHESLFRSAATLKPLGDKADWMIQPSRGRPTPPTSAADIALKPKTQVVSPVDGTVIDVITYSLYCEAQDTLVVIRPDQNRDVTVEVMHLVEVKVHKGDEVVAGGTLLGEPHLFGGGNSQVNAFVPGDPPHVHVEVESDGSRAVPGCDYPRGG